MKKELPNFELKISDENSDGVFAISLVDQPAIEKDFVLLSKIKVDLKVTNELKREVVGLALVPNKKIYRVKDGEEFTISFNEETIYKTQELYMKNMYNNSVTLEHEKKTNGVCLVESWIVEDTKNDKSNLYNLNAPKGSWVVKMKVDNDEVLQGIKNGTYNGFSIEGKYDHVNENLSDNTLEAIKDFLRSI